jgi:hypothetical protein
LVGFLVGDELEKAAIGISEIDARSFPESPRSSYRPEFDADPTTSEVRDGLGGGSGPSKAKIRASRCNGNPCQVGRGPSGPRKVLRQVNVQLPISDSKGASTALELDHLGPENTDIKLAGALPVRDGQHHVVQLDTHAQGPTPQPRRQAR